MLLYFMTRESITLKVSLLVALIKPIQRLISRHRVLLCSHISIPPRSEMTIREMLVAPRPLMIMKLLTIMTQSNCGKRLTITLPINSTQSNT